MGRCTAKKRNSPRGYVIDVQRGPGSLTVLLPTRAGLSKGFDTSSFSIRRSNPTVLVFVPSGHTVQSMRAQSPSPPVDDSGPWILVLYKESSRPSTWRSHWGCFHTRSGRGGFTERGGPMAWRATFSPLVQVRSTDVLGELLLLWVSACLRCRRVCIDGQALGTSLRNTV